MSTDLTGTRPTILVSANSAWNVVNFRLSLVEGLRQAGFEIVIAAPADGTEAKLRSAGFRFVPLPMSRSGMNPLADAKLLGRYWSIIRDIRPAVFLGFTIKPNVYGSIAARWQGVPVINNVSGLGTMFLGSGWRSHLAHLLYRLALARSRTVFFQNPDDRQLFIGAGAVKAEQSRVLPGSGIDLEHFSPTPIPPGPAVFLFIGRLLADKGVHEFVAAAKIVRKSYPDIRFQLLGGKDPGNRSSLTDAEIEDLRSSGLVELLGEREDVRPYIVAASAVVLPSYREGLPRVLLEASAMGRPLIATDVPGCRTIVAKNVNGLLCEARNPRSLADAMIKFAELPVEKRQALGKEARKIVEREYGQQRIVDFYLSELRDIAPTSCVGQE